MFAYLTDLQGHYQLYYDANDLPTIYIPAWGFCHPRDEAWNQTLQFALSTHNKGGFYPGVFGGLGSVHTPHPWPLGDVQELLYAQVLGDQERWQRVWQKLKQVVQWDGLFSEAISQFAPPAEAGGLLHLGSTATRFPRKGVAALASLPDASGAIDKSPVLAQYAGQGA